MSDIRKYQSAVDAIKTAILQSQARAAKAVNQEQLALYYGIGRYISMNTRNKNWGTGAIETISKQLRQDLPGLRGFGVSSLKNMRIFYEAWCMIEPNSPIAIGELSGASSKIAEDTKESIDSQVDTIRQLQLANFPDFPLAEFLSISFTHHIRILDRSFVLLPRFEQNRGVRAKEWWLQSGLPGTVEYLSSDSER